LPIHDAHSEMRNKIYRGAIGRLIIVAGQTGAGKTTFLERPHTFLSQDDLPGELADLFGLAKAHEGIMHLAKRKEEHFDSLCLHVDITNAVRRIVTEPKSREELLAAINPAIFSSWRELSEYMKSASRLDIITLFVRREEHFRRFVFGKKLRNAPDKKILTRLAAVVGDTDNKSELHRKVYSAWIEFTRGTRCRSHYFLDGQGDKYAFMSEKAIREELRDGYKSEQPGQPVMDGISEKET
jgi:hypothetical protein